MNLYRCRICGETYLGHRRPSDCPFCGAHEELLCPPEEFDACANDVSPTPAELAALEHSIALERSNVRFYLAVAARSDSDVLASAYKRLARIETEHCSLFCKLAGVPKPSDLQSPSADLGSWEADIAESQLREELAVATYTRFAQEAVTPRLRTVWGAIADVERDHVAFDHEASRYL